MNKTEQLERSAVDAHRLSWTWNQFWRLHAEKIRQAEPYDRKRYTRLVRRLLALVTSGNTDGMEPVGAEPWQADDAAKHADDKTDARCDWEAVGAVQNSSGPSGGMTRIDSIGNSRDYEL